MNDAANNASEIVLATRKIDLTQKIFADDQPLKNNKNTSWIKRNARVFFTSIVLFLLVFSFTRIPYTGAYIDDFLFEYLFGFTKYFIYAWLITICILVILKHKLVKKIIKPLNIVLQILIAFAFCLLFSSLTHWIQQDLFGQLNFAESMKYYHTGHFWPYVTGSNFYKFAGKESTWWMNTYYAYNNAYYYVVTGGLFGEFFASISYLFEILFSILLIVACVDIYLLREVRKGKQSFLITLFSRIFYSKKYIKTNELAKERDDVKINSISDSQIANSLQQDLETPPLSFLTETSVDHYQDNKVFSEHIVEQIKSFNETYGLNITYEKTIIMPLFTEIYWTTDQQSTIDQFIKNEVIISKFTKLNEFNISYKQNEIRFEYSNDRPSKISIKSILSNNKVDNNSGYAVVGTAYANAPLLLNLNRQSNILILGTKGSGSSMLLSSLLLSYAYLNAPSQTSIDIIAKDENVMTSNFANLPHTNNVSTMQIVGDNIGNVIQKYLDEITNREKIFESNGVSDFNEYTRIAKKDSNLEQLKHLVLVFCDYNEITRDNISYLPQIKTILQKSKACGITLIIMANEVSFNVIDSEIYDNMKVKLILKLASESESLQIFDNYRAFQLYGNGDGYYFEKNNDEKTRFQTCYLNQNELIETINIIKKFYNQKTNS